MASRTVRVVLLLAIISISLAGAGFAQQASCKASVPVGVVSATGESYRGLIAEDFSGHLIKGAVDIKSATLDDGPRRTLLVVDTSKKLDMNSHKAATEMVNAILAAGRSGDSFALVVTHGEKRMAKFGEERAKFTEIMGQYFESKAGQTVSVLDAVMEGMEWFGAPAGGDSIVVIAAELQGSRKANPKVVAKALEQHHIRMFGLALGPVSTKNVVASGTMTSTTSQGLAYATPGVGTVVYDTGDENFYPLTTQSGGMVMGVMNAGQKQAYNLDDPKAKQIIAQKALIVFNMISTFYRLEVEPPAHSEQWKVDVVDRIHKIAPQMWILYPHDLGPC